MTFSISTEIGIPIVTLPTSLQFNQNNTYNVSVGDYGVENLSYLDGAFMGDDGKYMIESALTSPTLGILATEATAGTYLVTIDEVASTSYTWDGTSIGTKDITTAGGITYHYISSSLTASSLIGATMTYGGTDTILTSEEIIDMEEEYGFECYIITNSDGVSGMFIGNGTVESIQFEGAYFIKDTSGLFTSKLVIN